MSIDLDKITAVHDTRNVTRNCDSCLVSATNYELKVSYEGREPTMYIGLCDECTAKILDKK